LRHPTPLPTQTTAPKAIANADADAPLRQFFPQRAFNNRYNRFI